MGVLERSKHVIRADLNNLLRKAKNPEAVLDAYLDDLETVLAEAGSIQSAEEAELQMYLARLRDLKAAQKAWQQKAASCLRRGDEELARTALERKLDMNAEIEELEREIEQRQESVQILKESAESLKARIAEVGRRRRELRFRRQLLEARSELQGSMGRLGHDLDEPTVTAAQDGLSDLESRLEAEESLHRQSLDDRILRMEAAERRKKRELVVDKELEQLRRRLSRKKS